ncbi:MAG TPA: SAM-dependent methyltransferase, partial [Burkholderiaceae bacterium]|nr:SAM-dependent methyltransferase [Burkholderiaceae bacterium]
MSKGPTAVRALILAGPTASGKSALAMALAQRLAAAPGCTLFVDYGPASATPADTLRAYQDG